MGHLYQRSPVQPRCRADGLAAFGRRVLAFTKPPAAGPSACAARPGHGRGRRRGRPVALGPRWRAHIEVVARRPALVAAAAQQALASPQRPTLGVRYWACHGRGPGLERQPGPQSLSNGSRCAPAARSTATTPPLAAFALVKPDPGARCASALTPCAPAGRGAVRPCSAWIGQLLMPCGRYRLLWS